VPGRSVALAALASLAIATGCATTAAHGSGTSTLRNEGAGHLASRSAASSYGAPRGALEERADAVARAFAERGAHPMSDRWMTFVPPDGIRTLRVAIDRPQCLGFVALGRESLGDIDIDLRNASAVRINQDNRNNAHPYVRACGRAGDVFYVLVRGIRGAGEVVVVPIADPPIVPPDLDLVLGVRNTAGFTPPRTPRIAIGADPSNIDAAHALDRLLQRFTPLGYRRVGNAINGRLDSGHTDTSEVELQAGRCYAIVAAGGPGVDDLDLRLLSPTGRPIAQDEATDNHPTLRTCPTISGTHDIQVRMYSGAGDYAIAILALDPPVELPPDMIGRERANTLELTAEGRRHGMTLMLPARRAGVVPGVPYTLPVDLRAGRCYLFGAAANELLAGLDLSLVDDHGAVVASDTATRDVAHVWHCPTRSQRARVEVRPATGRGEFGIVALESAHSGAAP
jgi:hypothetical protein